MKKISTLFLVLGLTASGFSQNVPFDHKNNVHLELGGHGLFYSFNYERILVNDDHWKMTAKGGVAYYTPASGIIGIWLPLSVNGLRSFGDHHLEFGIGQVITRDGFKRPQANADDDWDLLGSLILGYRYQKPEGRFLFRAAFTPFLIVNYADEPESEIIFSRSHDWETWMIPSGGLSFGYVF